MDHDGAPVPGPVGDPGLAPAVRQRDRERPGARVVRLVLLEAQRAAIEVDVLHLEARCLAGARALAAQETPEHAPAERDRGAREKARVLVGVEAGLRLRGAELREEAAGERVRREETAGEDGHRHEPVQELRDVTARGGRHRRERAHDALRVVEREGRDGDAAGDRVDVTVEAVDVLLHAALWLDVVGDELLALLGLLLGQLRVAREALAVVVTDEDADVEPVSGVAEERSRGPAGHGAPLLPRFAAALTPAAAYRRDRWREADLLRHRRVAAVVTSASFALFRLLLRSARVDSRSGSRFQRWQSRCAAVPTRQTSRQTPRGATSLRPRRIRRSTHPAAPSPARLPSWP
ncbi:uncharacterized protein SOCE26_073820 [Sorangium cellulosum]|uniref:Uncharacterized protein n=1 Tax=Sorangium cellulosum TaxID=56 RepID=A0A2L0F2T5_SORCE|nr:uncharacterized protein SOCE26_073820 [Sorangium cellulosum]